MELEQSLVLSRYLQSLLGAKEFEDIRKVLISQDEGAGPDGRSNFFRALSGRSGLSIDGAKFAEYDGRILEYQRRLAERRQREPFKSFKYFQYLALLYSEIYLDRLTTDPQGFLDELNRFRERHPDFRILPAFGPDDLRRLAFFMATGSGKTLILHANILQALYYLKHGKHPEALVRRSDGRREFDNILLITPGEGLSEQHLDELEDSGFVCGRFERSSSGRIHEDTVNVIEIHKLSEEPSTEGVSVPISELGARNLIIVDEGHKGTGSEARRWKTRQESLSRDGFQLEYSATFSQAIAASSRRIRVELLAEYGKCIAFDYSYRYFYGDGYGKAFRVFNLRKGSVAKAQEHMLAGLLVFYQQSRIYQRHLEATREYGIERPLWVLLGTSVSKKKADERDTSKEAEQERTDVAEVVAFIRRFLEDSSWAVGVVKRALDGRTGFEDLDSESGMLRFLKEERLGPKALYDQMKEELFHGHGGLEVVEIRRSGEIGLRVTSPSSRDLPYFGIINIGDVADFRKYLKTKLKVQVKEDVINGSLFREVDLVDSPINLLIGAKKFIEGWSSWRVSSMGLLRVGLSEGPQIMQMFGRGVRLKGKGKSLRRSFSEGGAPIWLEAVETLYIVGWKANHLETFRRILGREELPRELPPLSVTKRVVPSWALVPRTRRGFVATSETWTLDSSAPPVNVNLVPQVVSIVSRVSGTVQQVSGIGTPVTFPDTNQSLDILALDGIYSQLAEYKASMGYGNVFIPRGVINEIITKKCRISVLPEDSKNPNVLNRAVLQALKSYLDRFVRLQERKTESANAVPSPLDKPTQITSQYRIFVKATSDGARIYAELKTLLGKSKELLKDGGEPLPRLILDWHLFNPILIEGSKDWQSIVSVSPSPLVVSERRLVEDLREYWRNNKDTKHADLQVCLLRNLPKVGIGMYIRSGFYPDFIMWIRNRKSGHVKVVFLDPHGLHHEGVVDNERFEAINAFRRLSMETEFMKGKIEVSGFILAPSGSDTEAIPGAKGKTWSELERDYPLLLQSGDYIDKIFK